MYIGDGTGWNLKMSKRLSSVTTDLITFADSGNITTSGSITASSLTSTGDTVSGNNIYGKTTGFGLYVNLVNKGIVFDNSGNVSISERLTCTGIVTTTKNRKICESSAIYPVPGRNVNFVIPVNDFIGGSFSVNTGMSTGINAYYPVLADILATFGTIDTTK